MSYSTKCPKCGDEDQIIIGLNLANSDDVMECDKCNTFYSTTIFENKEEADEFTESQDGEVI